MLGDRRLVGVDGATRHVWLLLNRATQNAEADLFIHLFRLGRNPYYGPRRGIPCRFVILHIQHGLTLMPGAVMERKILRHLLAAEQIARHVLVCIDGVVQRFRSYG